MEPRDPTIGQRIIQTRERKGWKQKELATQTGIPAPTLNRIERGQQSLFAERVVTLARVLNVSADYLLGLTDTPMPMKRQRSRKAAPVAG
jgi:transcriptional regulator with XRE-family HTH domain